MPSRLNPNLEEKISDIVEALLTARVRLNEEEFQSLMLYVVAYIKEYTD